MATACSNSSRITRGIIGGILGNIVGFGVTLATGRVMLATAKTGETPGVGAASVFAFAPLLGTVVGATIGAWKPRC